MKNILAVNATTAWLTQCIKIMGGGEPVTPRGQPTLELRQSTVYVDMRYPLVTCKPRKLSYSFAAAEALWILDGDNRVKTIAPYNANIAQFSDDGVIFNGAYGPRIQAQLDFVLAKLREDRNTRQAVLTIWESRPAPSKDTPCTVAMSFMIRDDQLHCQVFMRSSDVWLGLPYDIFNFTLVAALVTCMYNVGRMDSVELGELTITAASSHAYERDHTRIRECVTSGDDRPCHELPQEFVRVGDWQSIEASLIACRDKHDSQRAQAWVINPNVGITS